MNHRMWVISVISRKGGAGKTTIAVHLATAASIRHPNKSVVIIDIDPQGSASTWGEVRKTLQGEEKAGPQVIKTVPEKLEATLAELKKAGVDFVVIDTAPHIHAPSLIAAKNSDIIIVPARMSLFDFVAMRQTQEIVGLAEKDEQTVVILNALPAKTPESDLDKARKMIGYEYNWIVLGTIKNRVDYVNSLNGGLSVQEMKRKSPAAKEMGALWGQVEVQTRLVNPDYDDGEE